MRKTLTAIAAAVFAVAGFAAPASAEGEKFVLISHAPDSDSWWNTIKNAIAVAGDQMKVSVEYRNVHSLHGQYFSLPENKIPRTPPPLTKTRGHGEFW